MSVSPHCGGGGGYDSQVPVPVPILPDCRGTPILPNWGGGCNHPSTQGVPPSWWGGWGTSTWLTGGGVLPSGWQGYHPSGLDRGTPPGQDWMGYTHPSNGWQLNRLYCGRYASCGFPQEDLLVVVVIVVVVFFPWCSFRGNLAEKAG